MTIRERTVYSFIELVSEVSGLADIFNITATLFLTFYSSQVQKAEFVKEMTKFRSRKRPELHGKSMVTNFLAEYSIRFRPQSNFWLTLTSGICPRPWFHPRNARLLKLQAQARDKIKKSLDISRAIEL
jgi:hypothetical protein